MLGLRRVTQSVKRPNGGIPIGFLVAIGIDLLLDDLLVGIGFAAGSEEDILLALAIALKNFIVGLTTSTELRESGMPLRSMVITTALLALTVAVGAILGVTVLALLSVLASPWYFRSVQRRCYTWWLKKSLPNLIKDRNRCLRPRCSLLAFCSF